MDATDDTGKAARPGWATAPQADAPPAHRNCPEIGRPDRVAGASRDEQRVLGPQASRASAAADAKASRKILPQELRFPGELL
jgi:hypothetical protein